eukprot:TRINITY_DN18892_c0_g1_i1.p1 TRINITY_DN18892_c0_g1~~TRINITY_DN18892_c0_g1_i1.p1  ORF type:complete len:177 (+),score=27.35 TRINITY_DN18892_c0_g1_i1:45-533(+)
MNRSHRPRTAPLPKNRKPHKKEAAKGEAKRKNSVVDLLLGATVVTGSPVKSIMQIKAVVDVQASLAGSSAIKEWQARPRTAANLRSPLGVLSLQQSSEAKHQVTLCQWFKQCSAYKTELQAWKRSIARGFGSDTAFPAFGDRAPDRYKRPPTHHIPEMLLSY